MQDQQNTNKENIPPTVPTQTKKPIRVDKVPNLTQQGRWTFDALEATMDVIEGGQPSSKKANKFWHIQVTSLLDHLNGKTSSRK